MTDKVFDVMEYCIIYKPLGCQYDDCVVEPFCIIEKEEIAKDFCRRSQGYYTYVKKRTEEE